MPTHNLREWVRRDGVGPIWWDGYEVLQRIFVTVRDRNWLEIPPTVWRSEVDIDRGTATLTARHESESVGFEWEGALRVGENWLRFEVTGRALRDMQVCRVGLVVLHPLESMLGSSIALGGPQGACDRTTVVLRAIAPQPVVNGMPLAMTEPFSQLVLEREDFGRLELRLEGELFELEDQRNWGDASFKTYCTPLRLGFPREMKAGTTIRHSVEVRFEPGARRNSERVAAASGVFPWLGVSAGAAHSAERRDPAWDHVHVDVGAFGENLATLREVLAAGPAQRIQLGVEVREDGPACEVVALLRGHWQRIARILLYGGGTALPSSGAVERWRREIVDCGGAEGVVPPLFAATKGYFVELNRGVESGLAVDGVGFPLTATVHGDDAEEIGANVSAIEDMAGTACTRTHTGPVCVAPLALYYPPSAAERRSFPAELVAPWLVATLIHAGLGGVRSVTVAGDVIESLGIPQTGIGGIVVRLLECGGRGVEAFGARLPQSLHAVKFTAAAPGGLQAVVANVGSQAAGISLQGMGPRPRSAILATTGETMALDGDRLDIPGLGVVFIE